MNPPESQQPPLPPDPPASEDAPTTTATPADAPTPVGVACPNCGRVVERGRFLCPNCGTSIVARQSLPIQPPAALSEEERARTPLLADLPAPHLRGEERELAPGKTFTKSEGTDMALGIAAPFVLSFLLTLGLSFLAGNASDYGIGIVAVSFLGSAFLNPFGLLLSGILYFVFKDRYTAFGSGMRKTLKVIGILWGILFLIGVGLLVLCLVGVGIFAGGSRP